LVVLLKQTLPDVKLAATLFYDILDTHINHAKMMLYVQQFKEEKLRAEEYAHSWPISWWWLSLFVHIIFCF
jgi:hypothetical protein